MFAIPTLRYSVIGSPEPPEPPLDKFSLQGEGGYEGYAYTFVDRGSAFFSEEEKNAYIIPTASSTNAARIKTFSLGANTYYYLDNVLKISSGNYNKTIMYRDGNVDYNSKASGRGSSYIKWIKDNLYNIADIFCPSNYGTTLTQLFLLNDGDLYAVDVENDTQQKLLSNVDRFLSKNASHNRDIIVSQFDGTMYQAWVKGGDPIADSSNGVSLINGVNAYDVLFCYIGDPPWAKGVCLKSDRKKIYRFNLTGGHIIKGMSNTPFAELTDPDEDFIHGVAHEFNAVFLTNKKIHLYHHDYNGNVASWYSTTYTDYSTFNFTNGLKFVTPTSYSVIIEATDGYYLMDELSGPGRNIISLQAPVKYDFYTALKEYLYPLRYSK
jgi:hypothetical protein